MSSARSTASAAAIVISTLPQVASAIEPVNPFVEYSKFMEAAHDWSQAVNPAFVEANAHQIAKNQKERAVQLPNTATIGSVIVSPGAEINGPVIVNVQISQPLTVLSR